MQTEVLKAWPSNILRRKIDDPALNQALSALAVSYEENLGGLLPENHCIWDWGYEPILMLKDIMRQGFQDWAASYGHQLDLAADELGDKYISHAWAQVYDRGKGANLHSHNLSDATAVYYCSEPDEQDPSDLIVHDPRWVSDEMLYVEREVTCERFAPQEGLLVVFPGYLWHEVPPYYGQKKRICYASTLEYSIVKRSLR